jgi:hypothetical protein
MFLTAKILGFLLLVMASRTLGNFGRIILVRKVAGKRLRRIWNVYTAMNIEETWIQVTQIRDRR